MSHAVYVTSHCFSAPIPDDQGRSPILSVLSLSEDGSTLELVQSVNLPEGTLMPTAMTMDASKTKLLTIAGKNGVVIYNVDPNDQGKIAGDEPICSAVTPEPFPTPYGVMPIHVTLDATGENVYICNFLANSMSALTCDLASRRLSEPKVCPVPSKEIPEKVQKIGPSKAGQALGFPPGFPEDAAHPHSTAIDPSGKWLVMSDLGTNLMTVWSLPVGDKWATGRAHFALEAHTAHDSNRHGGCGPRLCVFHPHGRAVFVVNELDHTVSAYGFDPITGELNHVGASQMCISQEWMDSVPPCGHIYNAQCNYNCGVAITPDGKHLYATSRGHDTVAGFTIADDYSLSPTSQRYVPTGGRTPWSVACASDTLVLVTNQYADDAEARKGGGEGADPERVYGQGSDPGSVVVFKRDPATGGIIPTGVKWEAPHVMAALPAG
jgi:6-phosphogluconolactonase (cycloisomerase 2 family)